MNGNNTTHPLTLIYTNHVNQRIKERGIAHNAIEMAKKYGTEIFDPEAKKIIIDYEACCIAEDDGKNLHPYFNLTIVITPDGILKTAYFKNS